MQRREFLKMGAAMGAAATVTGCGSDSDSETITPPIEQPGAGEETINWSSCLVNCGSNCPIKVYSKDGIITRVEGDYETTDEYGVNHHIRACPRGRALRQRTYATDRLRSPMKRVGQRGAGEFVPITWQQAYEEIGAKLGELPKESIYMHYGTGAYYGFSSNVSTWGRLLNMTKGGFLNHHWDYSWAQIYSATLSTFGTQAAAWQGTVLSEVKNSDLFVGFGFNPNEVRMSGSGEGYDFVKALEANDKDIKVWMVEPRYTDSMRGQEDEWLAVRPGTDAALIEAVIYQMINSGWVDTNAKAFLDKYAVGYDRASLENTKAELALHADPFYAEHAQYIDPDQNYHDYIMGTGVFTQARTPAWAAPICGVPARRIEALADAIMAADAPYISSGYGGVSRHANGDNAVRAIHTLAIMTGKIGKPGVNNGTMPTAGWFSVSGMPTGTNSVDVSIPVYNWADAVRRGEEFTGTTDGVRYSAHAGVDNVDHNTAKLTHNVKAIINCAGNALINQHSDINGTAELLQDETKVELIVVSDCWMTPSAKFADYLLPDSTWLESEDFANSSYAGGQMAYATFMSSSLKPLGESQSMYDICTGIAKAMGKEAEYTEGRTGKQWCEALYQETRAMNPDVDMPESYDEALEIGLFRKYSDFGVIANKSFIDDPVGNPLPTISGKFEIFSLASARKAATWDIQDNQKVVLGDNAAQITALPQYIVTWEGFEDAETADKYPMQLCGYHTKGRTHSSYHNVPWMREAVEDALWMNPMDAQGRGLKDGDLVQVYNDRGTIELPVKLTPRVTPGVCMLGQGAWYKADPAGRTGPSGHTIDVGGCINTLTKFNPTPIVKGNPQHTNRVQVVKA